MQTHMLYEGDCRELLPQVADPVHVALLLTDPPYGIALDAANRKRKRGALSGGLAMPNDYPDIIGDEQPFDPTHLLAYPRLCLFGANWYAHKLPPSPSWLVWDKINGMQSKRDLGFNDNADFELIWTNLGGAAHILPHRWAGAMKESERTERRMHPTQKPVALMRAIIEHYTQPGDLVVDPYMGAGSTIIAALECGRRAIGIEIESAYYEIAWDRVRACVARSQASSGTAPRS